MPDTGSMEEEDARATPYPGGAPVEVDAWSREIYNALCDWPPAQQGAWTRWDPGYLVLEITKVGNEDIEPIMIDTADEELTVTFGYWETHLPEPLGMGEEDAGESAGQAMRLIEDWLSGRLRTAVLTDDSGKWCGSALIEPGELLAQLRDAAQYVRDFNPTRIEVRTPERHNWITYPVDPEWLVPLPAPPLSPGRFPR